jgi:hypothetical protein
MHFNIDHHITTCLTIVLAKTFIIIRYDETLTYQLVSQTLEHGKMFNQCSIFHSFVEKGVHTICNYIVSYFWTLTSRLHHKVVLKFICRF